MINFTLNSQTTILEVLFSGIIGAIITLLGTTGAMFWVSNQDKKRWENDILQKKKVELLLKCINLGLKISSNISTLLLNQKENKSVEFEEKYIIQMQELKETSYELHIIADIDSKMKYNSKDFEEFYFKSCEYFIYFNYFWNRVKLKTKKIVNLAKGLKPITYIEDYEKYLDEKINEFSKYLE